MSTNPTPPGKADAGHLSLGNMSSRSDPACLRVLSIKFVDWFSQDQGVLPSSLFGIGWDDGIVEHGREHT